MSWYAYCLTEHQNHTNGTRTRRPFIIEGIQGVNGATILSYPSGEFSVIVSEFGSESRGGAGETGEQWVRHVLQVLHDHDWDWIAWDLHPSAGPRLISDWNYTPTPQFGVWVKQALLGTLPPYAPARSPASRRRAASWS